MNNEKGFTLAEMIIAIGILMLASGFILQIFITSKTMNIRAYDLDKSVSLASSVVETFKTSDEPMRFNPDADYTLRTQIEKQVTLIQNYDQNWEALKVGSKEAVTYQMICVLERLENSQVVALNIRVEKKKANEPPKILYALKAAQYVAKVGD
jgi:type II secretory pathway pseudopilin PulG